MRGDSWRFGRMLLEGIWMAVWEDVGRRWDCGFGRVFGSASKPAKKSGASRPSRAETDRAGHPFTESRLLPR